MLKNLELKNYKDNALLTKWSDGNIIIDNIIYDNKLEDNPIEIIKSLTYKELKELIKELDIKNTNTVIVKK